MDSSKSISNVHSNANGLLLRWNHSNKSSILKCSGCTWAGWSPPASASLLRASVLPPPCSRCVLHRLSDSSDYEHKSSTCQEILLLGLCNACLHLEMVWADDCCKWFAFIVMPFQHFASFNEGSERAMTFWDNGNLSQACFVCLYSLL